MFSTKYEDILQRIDAIDPIQYGRTRNYIDGAITKLSPYISRGVISSKQIASIVLKKGYKPYQIEKFLKELAWQDYFQQVWKAKGTLINEDLKQKQEGVSNQAIPTAILQHNTSITAIDNAIIKLHETGYMHNHVRMYVAGITCNVAQSHWYYPAKWMYYYLLDADWASNALSWQWVAGSFSSKKYYANQENINKYCNTTQQNSFLDISYEELAISNVPDVLQETSIPQLQTTLPTFENVVIDESLPTCIYNFYNLDANWMSHLNANRILLLEPAFFEQYPVCNQTIQFVINLSKNIKDIQIYVGDYNSLHMRLNGQQIHYKEHPTAQHYKGLQHSRDWMFEDVNGYYPSFFAYWKNCEKKIKFLMA